jgi:hypothetical protein
MVVEKVIAYIKKVGKPERKRPLDIPRCGWEDNIKLDIENRIEGSEFDVYDLGIYKGQNGLIFCSINICQFLDLLRNC